MQLRTLGGLELASSPFSRPKPLLLVAYLALEGPTRRRHLAELFWPGAVNPPNQLAVTLARLRRADAGLVRTNGTRVWTDLDSDAKQLRIAVDEQDYALADRLYAGPFLHAIELDGLSPELEEWVYATRDVLTLQATSAQLALAEDAAAAGDFRGAARRAERAFRRLGTAVLEPHDLHRIHTLLLAADHPFAVKVRQEAEGLGTSLSESPATARESLSAPPAAAQATAPTLPCRNHGFVGRDRELARLDHALAEPSVRLVTVAGAGGVGKSQLALEVAHRQLQATAFEAGVRAVFLESVSGGASVAGKIAEALGIALRSGIDPFVQVQHHIGQSSLLLILDNLEHVLEVAPRLSDLLRACPHLKILATSRQGLNLSEECLHLLDGLPFPRQPSTLAGVLAHDAATLFVRRAMRADPDFALTETDAEAVGAICRRLDGSPLGLELAASWVRLLSCEEIADELKCSLDLLSGGPHDVPDRHRSMRAAFEPSWRLLTAEERGILGRLSVFRGGFTRDAAADVAGATVASLASLVDKSLLRVDGRGRYDRHPLIHTYTQEKLAQQPVEQARAEARHAGYFSALAKRLSHDHTGAAPGHAYARLEVELENLRAAWQWAVVHASATTFAACGPAFVTYYFDRWRGKELVELHAAALATLDATDPAHREAVGGLSAWLGIEYVELGRLDEASALAESGLTLLRPLHPDLEDVSGLFSCFLVLAMVASARGHYRRAIALCQEQAALGLVDFDGRHLNNLGLGETWAGDYPAAKQYLRQALQRSRQEASLAQLVKALDLLGTAHLHSGEPEKARHHYVEAVALVRQHGPIGGSDDFALVGLGRAALALGDADEARAAAHEVLDRHPRPDRFRILGLEILARAATASGDFDGADRAFDLCFDTALELFGSIAPIDVQELSDVMLGLCDLRFEQTRYREAGQLVGFLEPRLHVAYHKAQVERIRTNLRAVMSVQELDAARAAGAPLGVEAVTGKAVNFVPG